jgi:hypothetical protein
MKSDLKQNKIFKVLCVLVYVFGFGDLLESFLAMLMAMSVAGLFKLFLAILDIL